MIACLPLPDFLRYIERGAIPPLPPELANRGGISDLHNLDRSLECFETRGALQRRGMFAIVEQVWTKALADWLGPRTVLEVMAGAGWLAKSLSGHGINVVATDDGSWHNPSPDGNHHLIDMTPIFPVERLDAREAVRKYAGRDVLVVSWPPYQDETIVEVCNLWGVEKPIVYIGEDEGGCTACDAFFARFRRDVDVPDIQFLAWPMIHDDIWIGYWTKD